MNTPCKKRLRPTWLPKGRQQVAAVCYRLRRGSVEFLLVQTRGGRWIFPKGGVEPGLTHAQSAALEAFEEAGVHGRIETIPFARYYRRKPEPAVFVRDGRATARCTDLELAVLAHLCEVSRLEPPQESNRNPTWFPAEKAKQRLLEDRPKDFGAELVRVVERALSRIQRLRSGDRNPADRGHKDGLQNVRFEALEDGSLPHSLREAASARNFLLQRRSGRAAAGIEVAVQAPQQKVLPISALEEIQRPVLRLGSGAGSPAEVARKITAIDTGRGRRARR
ncbi:MAG: NUDIX domain-containing protein [Terriglobales bacterium]|jgi:8-oxo-dGTP pyrophosphatase MutT (NUDIX family)